MQDTQRTASTSITQNTNNIIDRPDRAPEPAAYAPKISGTGLQSDYSYYPNGKGIAAALQTDTSKSNKGVFVPTTKDDLIYQTPELTLTIQDFYKRLRHYNGVTRQVFSAILRYWQQQKTPTININFYDYSQLKGITQDNARIQLLEQLELLKFVWFAFDDVEIKQAKSGKTFKEPVKREFASVQYYGKKRGSVDIELGNKFYKYLLDLDRLGQLTQKPDCYYKLSPKDDEYAILMCDYFTGLERTQAGQANYHKHAVATILEHCEFKTAEKLQADGERHFDRPIKQFERALQRLMDIGYLTEYTYTEKSGTKADYSRLKAYDYDYFITLNVCIETTAPDNSHLIETKAKRTKGKKPIK